MHTFRMSILALAVAGPLWAAVPPSGDDPRAYRAENIEAFRQFLFRRHVVCGDAAIRGDMPYLLAKACARNFMALKLTFVPGATLPQFEASRPEDRARLNAAGYAGFRVWLRDQVTAVSGH